MATITTAGAIPATPTELLNEELAAATALAPGLTANLPGSLIEDLSSTAAGALIVQDQGYVDLINSISPYTANATILYQLGAVYGVQQGQGSNTSVFVVFTGTVGFVIPRGFTVSDGSHQYTVQDGGIIGSAGVSASLYCLATTFGTWAVPANSVTQLVTSVPSGITLTCTNPSAGLIGTTAQTLPDYQAQVIQAGLAVAQGMPTFLRTQLEKVSGVQARLIGIRVAATNQWEIIVGGGDPYQVANAIFTGVFDISTLVGSATTARNVTVSIDDYPDTYSITYVNPPQQTVAVTITWNTVSINYVSATAVAQLANPAIVDYINSISVGQPINNYELQDAFQNAVESILPINLISKINTAVYINGTLTPPATGTLLIYGDPESYFQASTSSVTIVQG